MQSRFLFFIENLVVCSNHLPKSFGILNSVRPIVRNSSAWRSRNFRASAYFAIGVFWENDGIYCTFSLICLKLVLLEDARKDELLEVV